ncbi:PQQ-binding-like beta-propeller repeat protein [Rhodoblastus sp.]|uniref:outer membrane protein assembly factor BamB family protein n=1 Tax=Rhodoblastus sp. TaxID=1962975 RepID=UPI0035AFE753
MRSIACAFGVLVAILPLPASAQAPSVAPPVLDATLFETNCAVCHDNPATRAPARASLKDMAPDFIVETLTTGLMSAQGSALTPAQRVALAEGLTGRKIGDEQPMAGRCDPAVVPPLALDGPSWNGWGAGVENWRLQREPGVSAADLPKLSLKWAFGVPGAVTMFGQPTVAGGRIFFGAQNGHVYALDMTSGCSIWDYRASAGVRAAVTVAKAGGRPAAFFGDRRGHVYAVDAASGQTIWKVLADDEPATQITGAPVLFENRLYVPISVGDDSKAIDPNYQCCKGRGAVVALDAETGVVVWTTYMTAETAPQGRNAIGTQLYGPSGASVWSAPTIDARTRRLYVGTGDNHSAPATDTSDAVRALALDDGKVVWSRQLLRGDAGNAACLAADKTNCPEPHGPDYDIGGSPNLIALADGRRILTVGQKSGLVWGLDPDRDGAVVWSRRVGEGGLLGGVQWGAATDGTLVYVAVSDVKIRHLVLGQPIMLDPDAGGGLHALSAATGDEVWSAPPTKACAGRPNCSPAQSAAVTATPDYVLSGAIDGHLRAYARADGRILWDVDLARPFETVNRVRAEGGSLDSAGATVAGGMIFVNAGYGLYGGKPGNVLAAFGLSR